MGREGEVGVWRGGRVSGCVEGREGEWMYSGEGVCMYVCVCVCVCVCVWSGDACTHKTGGEREEGVKEEESRKTGEGRGGKEREGEGRRGKGGKEREGEGRRGKGGKEREGDVQVCVLRGCSTHPHSVSHGFRVIPHYGSPL